MAVTNKPRAVIVDIDGTVALRGDRSPYDETRVSQDAPNRSVIAVTEALCQAGNEIVFVSGRSENARDDTVAWLSKYVDAPYAALLMRQSGDQRRDSVIKAEIYDRDVRPKYDVLCVLDDRNQVVKMWRSKGLTVLQVAEGDF